jgi:hypothetical protein
MPQEDMSTVSPDEIYLLVGRLVVDNNHQLSVMEQKFQSMLQQQQSRIQEVTEKNSALQQENSILQQQLSKALSDDGSGEI